MTADPGMAALAEPLSPDRPPRSWGVSAVRAGALPMCDALALASPMLVLGPSWLAASYLATALLVLNVSGRQRLRVCLRLSEEIPVLMAAMILPLPILLSRTDSAAELAGIGAMSCGVLLTARARLYGALRAAHRRDQLIEATLIIGTGQLGVDVADLLLEHPELGLRPAGFVGELPPHADSTLPLLGDVSELSAVVRQHHVRRIIVCFSISGDADMVTALRASRPLPADVYVVPRMFELAAAVPASRLDDIWGIPLIPLRRSQLQGYGRAAKRAVDLIVATLLLIALGPVLLALMAAVLLCHGRPVLFRQARVTRNGRLMNIAKLRTITLADPDAEWSVSADQCSPLGRWLRATHFDELPQLLNVLRGEMSLVGPRPERPYFTAQFSTMIARYEDRHRVHTGLTGWAQVHGLTGDTSISDRVRFDNHYIEHWSLWLDIVILFRTLAEPLATSLRQRRPARSRLRPSARRRLLRARRSLAPADSFAQPSPAPSGGGPHQGGVARTN